MSGKPAEKITITLAGDWSMDGVAQQMPHLVEQLASLPGAPNRQRQRHAAESRPVVAMSGIRELDASGCQLLALFVRTLKQKGGAPLLTGVSRELREKILFLGFARELGSHFEFEDLQEAL